MLKICQYFKIGIMQYQLNFNLDQAYKKVSAGAINPTGGSPVCGSVPLALLNKRM
jgi:hypothetical protein